MTKNERIEFLAGQIHALMGFAATVIRCHPAPSVFAKHFDAIAEINLARAEGEAVSDDYVAGVLDVKERLKRATEIALAHGTGPQKEPR